jgi:ArsR family transcriptional regulator
MPAKQPSLGAGCHPPITQQPLAGGEAAALAAVFKALADPVRLRLLSLIASHPGGEACVCDLTGAFDVTGPTISHHLKVLREAGLIDSQRRGTWIFYWVVPAVLDQISVLFVPAGTVHQAAATGSPPGSAAGHAGTGRRRTAAAGHR